MYPVQAMTPKVSVVVATHNHIGFIDEALDSVMSQATNFAFEVIVSEDASTDGTREAVLRWQGRHPEIIRSLLSASNVRSNEVIRRGFHAARGDYVALLDGDDAWTAPDKLSRQVAVLEADPSLSLCFTNARVSGGTTRFGDLWTDPALGPRLGLADLWEGNPFPTCGSLFRRSACPRIPDWYCDGGWLFTDWPLYVLWAEAGDIAFLPEPLGLYRLHSEGAFSPLSRPAKLDTIDEVYRRINEGTAFRHDRALRRGRWRFFLGMAEAYAASEEPDLARHCLGKLRADPSAGLRAGLLAALRLGLQTRRAAEARA